MMNLDILDQLKNEHDQIKEILIKAQNCKVRERRKLVNEIKKELIPHARGEEKTIYSLLKGFLDVEKSPKKDINLMNEAYEEHRVIDDLLIKLEEADTKDERWVAHVKVLKGNLEHHIQEEEEDLFNLIRKYFSEERLRELRTVYLSVKATYSETLPSQAQIKERKPSPEILSL